MSDRHREELTKLGLIGLIPLIVAFIGVWLSPVIVPASLAFDLRETALIYGAMIASYSAGFGHGTILAKADRTAEPLTPGVVAALIAWIAAWPAGSFGIPIPDIARFILVIGALAYFLMRDLRAVGEGLMPAWYGPLRTRLTFWATISLAMIVARLLISSATGV